MQRTIGKYLFISLCFIQIIIGLLWLSKNLSHIPGYTDTRGYIYLSRTLSMPSLRVIGYPVTIRIASMISEPHFHVVVYLFQLAIFFSAVLYFLATLIQYMGWEPNYMDFCLYFMVALTLTTNPILLHFHLSIMADSLAMSFALLFLTALLALLYGPAHPIAATIIFAVSFFCLSLMRAEKRYFGLAVLGVILLIWLWQHRAKPLFLPALKKAGILLLLIVLLLSLINGLNRKTQAASSKQPPFPNLSLTAFIQVTWNHFADIYPRLPDAAQQILSYKNIVAYDELPYQHGEFIWGKISISFMLSEHSLKMLKEKGLPDDMLEALRRLEDQEFPGENIFWEAVEGHIGKNSPSQYKQLIFRHAERSAIPRDAINATLNTITMIALSYYWHDVALRIGTHFLQYLFSPFTFSYELITNGSGGFRAWTIKKMATHSPSLTNIFLHVGIGVLILQTGLLVFFHRTSIKRLMFPFMILFLGSIINSASFSLVMPRTWHVRYSLISYVTILLFLLSANMLGFFTISRKGDDEIHSHRDGHRF